MSKRYFPFHAMGFRCNPFRALTRQEWSQIALVPQAIEEALERDFSHLQIIGEQGLGKTSALLALKQHFRDRGHSVQYFYLAPGQRKISLKWRDIEILLIDEMQRLTQSKRVHVVKKIAPGRGEGPRLICSSHEDLTDLFAGQRRPLQTIPLRKHESEFVRRIIERRLKYFSEDGRSKVMFTDEAYRFLGETFANDLRSLEDFLYELFQQQQYGSEITVEVLRNTKVR